MERALCVSHRVLVSPVSDLGLLTPSKSDEEDALWCLVALHSNEWGSVVFVGRRQSHLPGGGGHGAPSVPQGARVHCVSASVGRRVGGT